MRFEISSIVAPRPNRSKLRHADPVPSERIPGTGVVEPAGGLTARIAWFGRSAVASDGRDGASHHDPSASGSRWRTSRLSASRRRTASCRSIGAASSSNDS